MPSKAITVKESIFCTISGFIRYVSGAYLGPSTDKFITGDTSVTAKFTTDFSVLFDKRFNVQKLI